MAGDTINVHTSSWWKLSGSQPDAPVSPLNDIVTALSNSIPGVSRNKYLPSQLGSGSVLNPSVTSFLNTRDATGNSARPNSWLNIVVLDEQLNPVITNNGKNSYYEQVGNSNTPNVKQYNVSRAITKSGYVYVYVSNETPNIYTYWDNLQVTHIKGPLLQEEGYYPFGLEMKAIGSQAATLSTGGEGQGVRYKFNAGTELEDNFDVNYYETYFRNYDAQIGRFTGVDAMSEQTNSSSPYHYSGNNPISFNDPTGLLYVNDMEQALADIDGFSKDFNVGYYTALGYYNESAGGSGGGGESGSVQAVDGGFKITGTAAQVYVSALQNAYSTDHFTSFLLIGGADLFGKGLSSESLELINEISKNFGVIVSYINATGYENEKPVVEKTADDLSYSYQHGNDIFIYGYSYGGKYAMDISRELSKTNTTVRLLITVDAAFGPESDFLNRTIPSNVEVNYNIYQTNWNRIGSHGDANTAINSQTTTIYNINVTGITFYNPVSYQNETISHSNIDQYSIPYAIYWINYYLNH